MRGIPLSLRGIPLSPRGFELLGPIRVNPRLFERFAQLFELSVSLRSAALI